MSDNTDIHAIRMKVVYTDPPDLIEIETSLALPGWSAVSCAYASPADIVKQSDLLKSWSNRPAEESRLEFGADRGIGWTRLRFYPINLAGHVVCHLTLATPVANDAREEEVRRLSVEIPTEPGLIERFASTMRHMAESLNGEAMLQGIVDNP